MRSLCRGFVLASLFVPIATAVAAANPPAPAKPPSAKTEAPTTLPSASTQVAPVAPPALPALSGGHVDASASTAAAASTMALTLAGAIQMALSHNPTSRAADYNVVAARGALVQASLLPNPGLGISADSTQIKPAKVPIPNEVDLDWPIPIGGKRGAGIDAARAGLHAAQAGRRATRRQVVLQVQTAFISVLLDEAQLNFEKQARARFRQSLALNELRYKDGKIAYGEVLKLRIQALGEDDAVREAAEALVSARADLRALVGDIVLAPNFAVDGKLEAPQASGPQSAEQLLRTALANRPDYLASKDAQKSAAALLRQARRQAIPDLDVGANYYTDPHGPGTYDLTLSLPLPVFDRNQGNVTQAQAGYAQAKLATDALRLQIAQNARKAVAEWRTAKAQLAEYTGEMLAAAKQSLDISRRAYDLGSGSLLDYLDAETSYRQVEIAYRAALARTMLAAATLRFVAGEDSP